METIELVGSGTILSGEVGLFRCITINSLGLSWNVGGGVLPFSSNAAPGDSMEHLSFVVYLVDVSVNVNRLGNRTSILVYTSDPNFIGSVTISCLDLRTVTTLC